MADDSNDRSSQIARHERKMAFMNTLFWVGLTVIVVGGLLLLAPYAFHFSMPKVLMGVIALMILLAVFLYLDLAGWSLTEGTKYVKYVGFWLVVAGFLITECATFAMVLLGLIVLPPVHVRTTIVTALTWTSMAGILFTVLACAVLFVQVSWVNHANRRRFLRPQ